MDVKYLITPAAIAAAFTLARIFPGHNALFAFGFVALGMAMGLLIDKVRQHREVKSD